MPEKIEKEDVKKVLSQYILSNDELENMVIEPRIDLKSGTQVDEVLPIFKDSLTVVSAPPKNGKSLFMLHLAMNLAWEGNIVLYISLENTLRQDLNRMKSAKNTYGKGQPESFFYINKERVPSKYISEFVYKVIQNFGEYDVIFIDATEKIISLGETGSEISKNGKEVLDNILACKAQNENKPAIVCSWQFSKQNLNNKIEEASLASLGGSISAVQMADSIWTIVRNRAKGEWKIKLLASREDYSTDKDTIDVYWNNQFDLRTNADLLIEDLKKKVK